MVQEILELPGCQPAFVNARTTGERPPQCTALHLACRANLHDTGHDVVQALLRARAEIDAVDARAASPVMSAASAAASPQFHALLNARAPLRRRSGGGSLPRPWCPRS